MSVGRMPLGAIAWPDLKDKYPHVAKRLADFIQFVPHDKEWKYFTDVTPAQWDPLMVTWDKDRKKGWSDTQRFVESMVSAGVIPQADLKNSQSVAGMAVTIGLNYQHDMGYSISAGAAFVPPVVSLVANNGVDVARAILGYHEQIDATAAFQEIKAAFPDLIKQHDDPKVWADVAKISKSQWNQLVQSAQKEKEVGPDTKQLIRDIFTAVLITAGIAAVFFIVQALLSLILLGVASCTPAGPVLAGPLVGEMVISIALAVIAFVVLAGCFAALFILEAIWIGQEPTGLSDENARHLINSGLAAPVVAPGTT